MVRLLLAQELMPVCLLMDVVLPITSTLLAVRVANSGVTALNGNAPYSQRLRGHYKQISHHPCPWFPGAMRPDCKARQQMFLWGSCLLKGTLPE